MVHLNFARDDAVRKVCEELIVTLRNAGAMPNRNFYFMQSPGSSTDAAATLLAKRGLIVRDGDRLQLTPYGMDTIEISWTVRNATQVFQRRPNLALQDCTTLEILMGLSAEGWEIVEQPTGDDFKSAKEAPYRDTDEDPHAVVYVHNDGFVNHQYVLAFASAKNILQKGLTHGMFHFQMEAYYRCLLHVNADEIDRVRPNLTFAEYQALLGKAVKPRQPRANLAIKDKEKTPYLAIRRERSRPKQAPLPLPSSSAHSAGQEARSSRDLPSAVVCLGEGTGTDEASAGVSVIDCIPPRATDDDGRADLSAVDVCSDDDEVGATQGAARLGQNLGGCRAPRHPWSFQHGKFSITYQAAPQGVDQYVAHCFVHSSKKLDVRCNQPLAEQIRVTLAQFF